MGTVLRPERRQGNISLSVKNGMLVINETYHFRVDTTGPGVTRSEVLTTPGLPIPNQAFSGTLGICKSTTAEREERNPTIWWVTCNFSSEVQDNTNANTGNLDPLTWTPVINDVFLEPEEYTSLRDKDGKPYTNGAGILIQNPPTQRYDLIRRDFFQFEPISKLRANAIDIPSNYEPIPLQDVISRNSTTNRETFLGVKKDKLLLTIKSIKEAFYYGKQLRLIGYSLTYNSRGWMDRIANTGDSFVYKGKTHPYRYRANPNTVVDGPLGNRDVKLGEELTARDALPSSWGSDDEDESVEIVNGEVFAKPPQRIVRQLTGGNNPTYEFEPDITVMHFIHRRRYNSLDFSKFLRVVNR